MSGYVKRRCNVSLKVSESEYRRMQLLAAMMGVSVSSLLRLGFERLEDEKVREIELKGGGFNVEDC